MAFCGGTADMNLSAIILAGGASKRMGQDKASVQFKGYSLLSLAVEKVRQLGIQEVFISGRTGIEYSTLNCPVLSDLDPGCGPLGGIERGLHASSSTLLLVLAVDLPHMDTAFLEKLIAQCDGSTGVVPKLDGWLEPLAAIYPKRCHLIASDFLARSRRAAHEFAERCLEESAVRIMRVAHADAGCFTNWNTPADITTRDGT
jgi:molybdenum cofactor guanylyltransferase